MSNGHLCSLPTPPVILTSDKRRRRDRAGRRAWELRAQVSGTSEPSPAEVLLKEVRVRKIYSFWGTTSEQHCWAKVLFFSHQSSRYFSHTTYFPGSNFLSSFASFPSEQIGSSLRWFHLKDFLLRSPWNKDPITKVTTSAPSRCFIIQIKPN